MKKSRLLHSNDIGVCFLLLIRTYLFTKRYLLSRELIYFLNLMQNYYKKNTLCNTQIHEFLSVISEAVLRNSANFLRIFRQNTKKCYLCSTEKTYWKLNIEHFYETNIYINNLTINSEHNRIRTIGRDEKTFCFHRSRRARTDPRQSVQ